MSGRDRAARAAHPQRSRPARGAGTGGGPPTRGRGGRWAGSWVHLPAEVAQRAVDEGADGGGAAVEDLGDLAVWQIGVVAEDHRSAAAVIEAAECVPQLVRVV